MLSQILRLLSIITLLINRPAVVNGLEGSRNSCYRNNKPFSCTPGFVNAASELPVTVTNTCGEDGPEDYCLLSESSFTDSETNCDICDASNPEKSHPAKYLTDIQKDGSRSTWWQSSTMNKGYQYPNSVNLTINLGKAFEITYVKITFFTSRPESFAIYKKISPDADWTPFQYYSASCEARYNMSSVRHAPRSKMGQPLCSEDESDISPLTDASVVFTTLAHRPRPPKVPFDELPALIDFVTASDIMISLNKMNTWGDEAFEEPRAQVQYFYGIHEINIGARCKCNGHANECVKDGGILRCFCQHNTAGVDCEKCQPFYNDLPWKRGTLKEPFECKPCDCNGRSETCEFDPDLYSRTGHGGRCTNCREDTSGPHCELCALGFYMDPDYNRCFPCFCNVLGSENEQCEMGGACRCKPGVHGEKCDRCLPYHYNLTITGCEQCRCNWAGILPDTQQICSPVDGQCSCKQFVQGVNCDECRDGYYGLTHTNPLGCSRCFCYGHSTDCSLDDGFYIDEVKSSFKLGTDGWKGEAESHGVVEVEHLSETKEITLRGEETRSSYYFVAPVNFLGDIHHSHNLLLSFDLRVDTSSRPVQPNLDDILIVGGNGVTLKTTIYSQGNPVPNEYRQNYKFFLSEHGNFQWFPNNLNHVEFARVLSNVTAIKIRAVYSDGGVGFLSNVVLQTVSRSSYPEVEGEAVPMKAAVEFCKCPEGYVGQFCESCAPGFKRHAPYSGSYGICVPCTCNGHSEYCEPESGQCICQHSTTGINCESCMDGYYGNALNGTDQDCKPCGCPDNGRCAYMELSDQVVCLDCKEGYGGLKCDICTDGYYGEKYSDDDELVCNKCDCNNNVDPNDVSQCHYQTGQCLKCKYNTTGHSCQSCHIGYYGEPIGDPHGACYACDCFKIGTLPEADEYFEVDHKVLSHNFSVPVYPLTCDLQTGQCRCRDNVVGRRCDQCVDGTWNIASGEGCEDCACNPIGSRNSSCDVITGQCHCKPGVGGVKCDQCLPYHFGFSIEGCSNCTCDYYGSTSLECSSETGQCPCRHNYVGRSCNTCSINRYNLRAGCVECPLCYGKVRDVYFEIKDNLGNISHVLQQATNLTRVTLTLDDDDDDDPKLREEVKQRVQNLVDEAKRDDHLNGVLKLKNDYKSVMETRDELYRAEYKMDHLNRTMKSVKKELETTEYLLQGIDEELKSLKEKLEKNGDELLNTIRNFKESSGKQSDDMSAFAQQAREQLAKLKSQKENLENSTILLSKIRDELSADLFQLQGNHSLYSGNVVNLQKYLDLSKNLLATTKNNTAQTLFASQTQLNHSSVLLEEVKELKLPDVDLQGMNDSVSSLEQVKELNSGLDEHYKDLHDHNHIYLELKHNLENVTYLGNQEISEYLDLKEKIEHTHKDANDTEHGVKQTVEETRKVLDRLESFEDKRQKSKEAADEAMKKLDNIRLTTANAEKLTTDTQEILRQSNVLVRLSNNAEHLSHVQNIHNESEHNLQKLQDESYVIFLNETEYKEKEYEEYLTELENLEKSIASLEERDMEDRKDFDQVLMDMRYLQSAFINYLSTSEDILSKIKNLNEQYNYFDPVDQVNLNKVQKDLETHSKTLENAEFDSRYAKLEEKKKEIETLSEDYELEVHRLANEIDILREISIAIPATCVGDQQLEVPATERR